MSFTARTVSCLSALRDHGAVAQHRALVLDLRLIGLLLRRRRCGIEA
jgi:hypothetical protein